MEIFTFVLASLFAIAANAQYPTPPPPTPVRDLNAAPPQPLSTACGDIVDANIYYNYTIFYASDVIDCLTSVPFNAAVATRFLSYYNQTLQFQSTTAYLRNPTPGYQQPAVDIFAGLQNIQNLVNAGHYLNQYAFEADLLALSQAAHDSHLALYVGITNQFTFASPFYIVSVSSDGKQTPQVYLYDDLVACNSTTACTASPITKINNQPTTEYLTAFAQSNSFGMLEPNADWNQMMVSPAQLIIGSANSFSGGATFYPGDYMILEFQNGRMVNESWLAIYNSPGFTGPLATGGDFYNFFVLGNPPANFDQTYKIWNNQTNSAYQGSFVATNLSNDHLTSWHSISRAYPADTISHQQYLGLSSPGYITGYFLEDISTAVVSIPSFSETTYGDGIDGSQTFDQAIIDFIGNASQRNAEKLIIDLQQNDGGQESLAYATYYRFFPLGSPFAGSRMRSHYLANILGNTLTNSFQELTASDPFFYTDVGEEWVVTDRIDADTGENFTSWAEFYGPLHIHGDDFSHTEVYNLTDIVFDSYALDFEFGTYDDRTVWKPKDIVILTDGTCDSACTLFLELMQQQKGIRTVVVGGRPEAGPMQAASGSRGASAYTSDYLVDDMQLASAVNETAEALLPQTIDTGMLITYAGINLRDQIRFNATTPNQFLYMPADCRIYWTLANWNNYTRLWHDTWNAIYGDTSICVPGSLNATAPAVNFTSLALRRRSSIATVFEEDTTVSSYIRHGISSTADTLPEITEGEQLSESHNFGVFDGTVSPNNLILCETKDGKADQSQCAAQGSSDCLPVSFPCLGSKKGLHGSVTKSHTTRFICSSRCNLSSNQGGCSAYSTCQAQSVLNTNHNSVFGTQGKTSLGYSVQNGLCVVQPSSQISVGCSRLTKNAKESLSLLEDLARDFRF